MRFQFKTDSMRTLCPPRQTIKHTCGPKCQCPLGPSPLTGEVGTQSEKPAGCLPVYQVSKEDESVAAAEYSRIWCSLAGDWMI